MFTITHSYEEFESLRAEVERLTKERDEIHDAIGIFGVDEPMTTLDAAQRLKAERDEAREGESARAVERDEARKERDDLRLRGYAELSMLAEGILRMTQECYPSTASPRDREILHRHGEAMATKLLRDAMEVRDSWPRTGVVDGMTRLFPTHADLDAARKERDSLRALLKSAEVVVQAFATDNPRWRDVRGEWQDPCGATALLAEIASALGAAR